MALSVGGGDSDNLYDVYYHALAVGTTTLVFVLVLNAPTTTSLTTTPMGYPIALDSESPVSQDWDLNFEEIQCAGAYKISPRLRHSAFQDHADSPCIGAQQTGVLASPTLPLFSATTNKDSFKAFNDFEKSVHLGHAHRTTTSMRVFGTFQARIWKSKSTWLVLYFSFNLLLTLSNKSVLTSFSFPYTLSALHALCSSLGGLFLRWHGFYEPKRLSGHEEAALAVFSFLYSLNIAVSNVSLNMVTVPFHQVVRAVTPIFTLFLSALLLNTQFTSAKLVSLAPVILGVIFATYGDYYFTLWGLVLTLFGTLLAAMKTIFTSVLQSSPQEKCRTPRISTPASWTRQVSPVASRASSRTSVILRILRRLVPPRLEIHPLDLLTRMSPLAFVQCMIYSYLSGELDQLRTSGVHSPNKKDGSPYGCLRAIDTELVGGITVPCLLVLLLNGGIAFGLNVVSLSANGKVGPLSMTVAANVKQVLTILFAVSMFNLTITPTNALGISVTIVGGAWYGWIEYTTKTRLRKKEDQNLTTK